DRFVASLRTDAGREDGILRLGFETFLTELSGRLQHDAALRARLNSWTADTAAALTERYRHEAAAFVAAQVQSWDTRHAVRTIELAVGKDLQFIRINGTLIGGLVGLVIYIVTHAVGS